MGNLCEFMVNLVCIAVCASPGLHGEIPGGKKKAKQARKQILQSKGDCCTFILEVINLWCFAANV